MAGVGAAGELGVGGDARLCRCAVLGGAPGASPIETGIVLALGAVAYIGGNLTSRRLVRLEPTGVLVVLAGASGFAVLVFASADCGMLARTVLFSVAAFFVGGRTMVSSAFAVAMPLGRRGAVTSLRASTMQFGYVVGSSLGGLAVAVGGYRALGATTATLFLLGAVCLAWSRAAGRARPVDTPKTARVSSTGTRSNDGRPAKVWTCQSIAKHPNAESASLSSWLRGRRSSFRAPGFAVRRLGVTESHRGSADLV